MLKRSRFSPARSEFAKTTSLPRDTPFPMHRSRLAQRLHVPKRTPLLFLFRSLSVNQKYLHFALPFDRRKLFSRGHVFSCASCPFRVQRNTHASFLYTKRMDGPDLWAKASHRDPVDERRSIDKGLANLLFHDRYGWGALFSALRNSTSAAFSRGDKSKGRPDSKLR